jgi:hypothetical protein
MTSCRFKDVDESISEPEYDFSVYFGEVTNQVKIADLIEQYKTETGKKIEAIFSSATSTNLRSLRQALKATEPPAAFVLMEGDEEENTFIDENGYKDEESSPAAFTVDAKGLAVDRRILDELVAGDSTDALLEDLANANYAEWHTFVETLDKRIRATSPEQFILSGHTYTFTDKDGKYTADLNGVFSIDGGDEGFYGKYLLDLVFLSVDSESFTDSKNLATPEAFTVADPPFSLYLKTLQEYTDHIAGSYGPGIRGSDFVSVKNYGKDMAFEIFANGRAVFTPVTSVDFEDINNFNANKAANLTLIPLKLPFEIVGLSGKVDEKYINTNIPFVVSHNCYVNAKANKGLREEAKKFIAWMIDDERVWENSIERSARQYYDKDRVIIDKETAPLSEDFLKTVLNNSGVHEFLGVEKWTDERVAEFKDYLFASWYDN